jgi:hypothetical protein
MSFGILGIWFSLLAPLLSAPFEGVPPRFVIVQPGYPGTTKDAEEFVGTLAAYVDGKAGLTGLAGEYHNDEKGALQAIEKLQPPFGIVSLGFYLAHRRDLGLKPLLQSEPKDNFVILARPGEVKDPSELKGKAVAGPTLQELPFLQRVVFRGKADVASWDSKIMPHASRTVRDLVDKKKHQAAVLTGRDYGSLKKLYPAKSLEKIAESEYYPPALLVAFHARPTEGPASSGSRSVAPQGGPGTSGADRAGGEPGGRESKPKAEGSPEAEGDSKKEPVPPVGEGPRVSPRPPSAEVLEKVVQAFAGLPKDPRGKEILATMGAEGFTEIPAGWLEKVEGNYDAEESKK